MMKIFDEENRISKEIFDFIHALDQNQLGLFLWSFAEEIMEKCSNVLIMPYCME